MQRGHHDLHLGVAQAVFELTHIGTGAQYRLHTDAHWSWCWWFGAGAMVGAVCIASVRGTLHGCGAALLAVTLLLLLINFCGYWYWWLLW